MIDSINSRKFKELIDQEGENLEIVDVREEDEFKIVRIKDSKLIPMGEIMNSLDRIDWNKKIILVCRSGGRSSYIANLLSNIGKNVTNLDGGIISLEEENCECLEK